MSWNDCAATYAAMCSPPEPEGIGAEKYDETTAAMIALLKYGSGMPFHRLEKLEDYWGFLCLRQRSGRSWKKRRR